MTSRTPCEPGLKPIIGQPPRNAPGNRGPLPAGSTGFIPSPEGGNCLLWGYLPGHAHRVLGEIIRTTQSGNSLIQVCCGPKMDPQNNDPKSRGKFRSQI